jgi:hypothetical protein
MKAKIRFVMLGLIALFIANQASAYYSPSTGRWLSRDPMGEPGFELLRATCTTPQTEQVASTASLPQSRLFVRDSEDEDYGANAQANQANLYNFVNNRPVMNYDLFGLCVPLQYSWQGDIDGPWHTILHNINHGFETSTLTFDVCCPATAQYLQNWAVTSLVAPPPTTGHGHKFPDDYTTVTSPTGSGPCYKIVIRLTSTATRDFWLGLSDFVDRIRIAGQCCACSSGAPKRTDNNPPQYTPPPGPPPHHGGGL